MSHTLTTYCFHLWHLISLQKEPMSCLTGQISADLLDVVDQGVAVLLPVGLQCVFTGELVTAELQSDLKAVAAQVIEVLHTC